MEFPTMDFLDIGEYLREKTPKQPSTKASFATHHNLPFPLRTVIRIHGQGYDFHFGKETDRATKTTTPWTIWKQAWSAREEDTLGNYLRTWFPLSQEYPQPNPIDAWGWKGVTEVFDFNATGCFLQELFLHLGNEKGAYPDFLGTKPIMVMSSPLVMQYSSLNLKCQTHLNGRFLLGRYESMGVSRQRKVIEITVQNGILTFIQDVTALVKSVKYWLLANPGANVSQVIRQFPQIAEGRSYWV